VSNTWLDCMIQNGDSPATFVASIAGRQMTVSQVITGNLAIGQDLAGAGVAAGTRIVGYEDAFGQAGTYAVGPSQTIPSGQITATMTLRGHTGPLDNIDLLTLGPIPADQAIYMSGATDRIDAGTVVQLSDGSAWSVVLALGRWGGWVKLAVKQVGTLSALDFTQPANSGLAPSVS